MTSVKSLYDLQQIDIDIQREQEALDEINRQLGESEALLRTKAELVAEQEHLDKTEKQQRDVEWEIEDLRTSLAQVNDKLYGGATKNPKELVSLEKEAEIFKAKLRGKEDKLMDLMAEAEAIQDKMKLDGERLKKLEVEWKQEQKALTQKQTKEQSRLSDLSRKRQALVSEIIPQTIGLYEG